MYLFEFGVSFYVFSIFLYLYFCFFFTPQAHAYSIEGLEDINKPQPLHSLKARMEEIDKQIIRIDGSKSQPQKYVQGVDGT